LQKRLLATLLVGHLMTDLNQGMLPALLPFFIAQHGLSYSQAGGLLLAANVSSSVLQPLFGHLADRRPSPWLVPAGVLLAGFGVAVSGVAPSYVLLALSVAVCGVGVAAFHPEGSRAANVASGPRRATGMSIFATGGNLGVATGPLVITPLILALGLHASITLLLPMTLVAAILHVQLRRLTEPRRITGTQEGPTGVADRWGPFARLTVAVVARSIVYTALSAFVPLFWANALGRSRTEGATALSLVLGTGVFGTLAGGRLADRHGRRIVVLASLAFLPPLLVALGTAHHVLTATALLVPLGLALYIPFSVLVVMAQEYLPNHIGMASGVTLGLSVTMGGFAAPLLGMLADRKGVAAPILVAAALPVVALAAALTLPDDRRAKTQS
jgi:FSR family fosmidomycin resistance protein-like MFS transporter